MRFPFRLATVRAKLAALVLLALLPIGLILPLLAQLLSDELHQEVDDRLDLGERAFQVELQDDIAAVRLAAGLAAGEPEVARALAGGDPGQAVRSLDEFSREYPGTRVYLLLADGRVFARQGGAAAGAARLSEAGAADLSALRAGRPFAGVVRPLCGDGPGSGAGLAYGVGAPVRGEREPLGAVLACFALDQAYLRNSAAKMGLQLAFHSGGQRLETSPGFPPVLSTVTAAHDTRLVRQGGRTFALQSFEVPILRTPAGPMLVTAAADVTAIQRAIWRQLALALLVLAAACALALWLGRRLATQMAGAVHNINSSLKELQQRRYVPVVDVRTGDELEQLAAAFNHMVEGLKERDRLRDTFGKYVTRKIADKILAGQVQLGGEVLQVTILFCDIRSFTSRSEKMGAEEVVKLLNEYFTAMVTTILVHDGVVDKYMGDGIMAVWGAPAPEPLDTLRAVRAAIGMREALAELNRALAERGVAELRFGIGLHSGEVVAGNIGSEVRMEYTVIGDAVNLASRLESMTKEMGVDVLISEDTYREIAEQVEVAPLRRISVRGRQEPVMVYHLLGLREQPLPVAAPAAG